MNKIAQKIGLNEKLSKNFFAIIVVAFGGAIIYASRISDTTIMPHT